MAMMVDCRYDGGADCRMARENRINCEEAFPFLAKIMRIVLQPRSESER